ncbi:MAG: HAD family phosphatase [Lachnospiraceae bacterium]|nr:HAD family phosphatase [Lachnospiraceae bacterium]
MAKILFTDLDDTLLTSEKTVCQENKEAIQKLLAQGHKIVLTSGRSLPSVRRQAEHLNLTFEGCYLICYNGGEIYDVFREKTLYRNGISFDILRKAFQIADSMHIHIQTYDNTYVYCHREDEEIQRYCQEMDCEYQVVPDVFSTLTLEPSKAFASSWERPAALEELRHALEQEIGAFIDVFYSSPYFLEIVPKGINKGSAVQRLCSLLQIPLENTVATGDAMNDIQMIETAHVGVAMKNATEDVKAAADYITSADNNHGGVAEAISKFILGKD